MLRKYYRNALVLFLLLTVVSANTYGKTDHQSDSLQVKNHLKAIINTPNPRNYQNLHSLNMVASYIDSIFRLYADTVYFQPYQVDGKTYKNVIAVFGDPKLKTKIIGAHYDVCGNQDGADDNASGVVALLELARMLANKPIENCIELVAYTLEEPPYFRTEHMGSYIHAKSLIDNNRNVAGMVSVEMIGFYSDKKHSQQYPIKALSLIYGNKGNYITLVNKFGSGRFARKFTNTFKRKSTIKTKRFKGPIKLPGLDFSDHLNYWKYGISALMITDTSFYRTPHYHEKSDTLKTLNIAKMCLVINSIYTVLA